VNWYARIIRLSGFKESRAIFISQGFTPDIVDYYMERFKEIKDTKELANIAIEKPDLAPSVSNKKDIGQYSNFKDLESVVDYISGLRPAKNNPKNNTIPNQNQDTVNFNNATIVYSGGGLEVYHANSPQACIEIRGNNKYSWCIARTEGNMFNAYRLNSNSPTFYFVKNIQKTKKEYDFWATDGQQFGGSWSDKYHFFIVQTTKNPEQFIVTSANNDGDIAVNWDKLVSIEPVLKNLRDIFKNEPLSEEEKKLIIKYQKGISDEDFSKLDYKNKEYYIDIHIKLSDQQFSDSPPNLKNKYIGFGLGLTDKQYSLISNDKNLVKRYKDVTNTKFEEAKKGTEGVNFKDNEIKLIPEWLDTISKSIVTTGRPPDFAYNWVQNILNKGEAPKEWINVISKSIVTTGVPPNFAQYWVQDILNKGEAPKEWIAAISEYIVNTGKPPRFAYYWVENILNKGEAPKEWIDAINRHISTRGVPPNFANNWAKNILNKGEAPKEWIDAINKYIATRGEPPDFAKGWFKKRMMEGLNNGENK